MKKLGTLLVMLILTAAALTVGAAAADIKPSVPATDKGGVYQISTDAELYWFAGLVNGDEEIIGEETEQNADADAVLTADITINEGVLAAVSNGTTNGLIQWTPIGNGSSPYTGTFDGGGHTISGLYCSISDSGDVFAGLFGYVGSGGTVQDLTIADSYISGTTTSSYTSYAYVGGVCGYNTGKIENCSNSGTVTGSSGNVAYAGGVCGWNYGTITGCYNSGAVEGSSSSYVCVGGVCGENGSGGEIENCSNSGAVSGTVTSSSGGAYAGGVCGYNNSGGTIAGCSNRGTVEGSSSGYSSSYAGGVCGWNDGTITGCSNRGTVESSSSGNCASLAGGVCGSNNGTITGCYNSGDVSGATTSSSIAITEAGGVCGSNYGTITGCFSSGKVSGSGRGPISVGGVCGSNGSTITGCFSSGAVSGAGSSYTYVGGVCGVNASNGTITGCFSSGDVSGSGTYAYVGGVCGYNNGTIKGCFSSGDVSGSGSTYVGGVCGYHYSGTITNCYWLGTAYSGSGIGGSSGTSTGVESKTDEEFASGEVAWLLNGKSTDGPWRQTLDEDDFPVLDDTHGLVVPDGSGGYRNVQYENGFDKYDDTTLYQPAVLEDGVYQISNAGQLYWFAGLVNGDTSIIGSETQQDKSADAVLTADITINEGVLDADGSLVSDTGSFIQWTPIGNGSNRYTGTFDGGGHTISGLYVDIQSSSGTVYAGLFGSVGSGGTVRDLNLADSYISGTATGSGTSYAHVGGVCGQNYNGTITSCSNSGAVTGTATGGFVDAYVGGVCGYNTGMIENCSNSGAVTGSSPYYVYAGGVCGWDLSNGTITSCFNSGTVSGNGSSGTCAGGVCGLNSSNSTITNCYWLDTACSTGIGSGIGGGGATSKSKEAFASGEVAWLLNSQQENGPWRQTLGQDKFPVLEGDAVVYRVTFTVADEDRETGYSNSPVTLPAGSGNTGYHLVWSDGEGNTYNAGEADITADTSFTGQWTANSYTVTFQANGGEGTMAVQSFTYDSAQNLTANAFTRSGYTFAGWSTTVDGGVEYTNGQEVVNLTAVDGGAIILYAQWTASSSSGGSSGSSTYTVTVAETEHGTVTPSPSRASKGTTITVTVTPDEGYELASLTVTDAGGSELELTDKGSGKYTFIMPASKVTVKAVFAESAPALPFADVPEDYWAYDEIAWVWESGYMSGTAATFNPGGTVSRQQVWMILARMAGADPADMAAAKAWAVASGISDGTDPGSAVTRQQLAALLYRYAVLSGYDVSVGEDTNILSYTDFADLSEYAVPAMQWACGAGIINGTGDGSTLSPQGTATRAQLAVMLYRWLA